MSDLLNEFEEQQYIPSKTTTVFKLLYLFTSLILLYFAIQTAYQMSQYRFSRGTQYYLLIFLIVANIVSLVLLFLNAKAGWLLSVILTSFLWGSIFLTFIVVGNFLRFGRINGEFVGLLTTFLALSGLIILAFIKPVRNYFAINNTWLFVSGVFLLAIVIFYIYIYFD
jgi:hypothetical protein